MTQRTIALYGCGVVGSGVYRILTEQREALLDETGIDLRFAHVCVRDLSRAREVDVPRSILTTDIQSVSAMDDADIVIEVMGGERDALGVVSRALVQGRAVITANKELIAGHLPRLRRLERLHGGVLLYGASVCGSVPVLKIIDETLATDRITRVRGIVNGSTNYILSRLGDGVAWPDALALARANGFLEADPTDDLSGADAARKLSILAYHAFGQHVPPDRIATTGIESLGSLDGASAAGARIKLVAEAALADDGLRLSVAPRVVAAGDPLGAVHDELNAVEIECEGIGTQRYVGRGAGSLPTANAVVSDVLDALARRRYRRRRGHFGGPVLVSDPSNIIVPAGAHAS